VSRRDLAASIRQRLLDRARAEGRPFQELLQYYAMERFLYRLSQSPHRDRFILKGALLLTAWRSPESRPTKDIDLEGRTSNDPEEIMAMIREICGANPGDDGIHFDPASVVAERITEDAEYEGIRVRFRASLAKARITMQVDVAFGDTIVPGPVELEYPTILDLPAPVLPSYPKESVVAEKLEAITVLGMLNSRLKDYFDLWLLSRLYAFDGDVLAQAVSARSATVAQRSKPIRSALENRSLRTQRGFANGARSGDAAGSRSPRRTSGFWFSLSGTSPNPCCLLWRPEHVSRHRGRQVALGSMNRRWLRSSWRGSLSLTIPVCESLRT
jgi:hypothetical protein